MTGSNGSLNLAWPKLLMSMRYINSLRLRWDDVYGEIFCQQNLLTTSYCSLGWCASWQRPQSALRMHDHRIQLGELQCDNFQGKILLLRANFPHLAQMPAPEGSRECGRWPQPSKPTWVSVQDVVLNSLRPSTQPSQPLPELSHFYQTHKHRNVCSCRYVLVGVSRLDTKWCGVAS